MHASMMRLYRMVTCLLAAGVCTGGRRTRVLPLLTGNAVPPRSQPRLWSRVLSGNYARIQPAETAVVGSNARHGSRIAASAKPHGNKRMEGIGAPRDADFDAQSRWNDLIEGLRATGGADVDAPLAGLSHARFAQTRRFTRVSRAAAVPAPAEIVIEPEDDIPEDAPYDVDEIRDGQGTEDADKEIVEIDEPTPEMIDEWENSEAISDIVNFFRDESSRSTDSIKLRDMYKFLMVMGMQVQDVESIFLQEFDEYDNPVDEDGNPLELYEDGKLVAGYDNPGEFVDQQSYEQSIGGRRGSRRDSGGRDDYGRRGGREGYGGREDYGGRNDFGGRDDYEGRGDYGGRNDYGGGGGRRGDGRRGGGGGRRQPPRRGGRSDGGRF